jgi:hypothetical protein
VVLPELLCNRGWLETSTGGLLSPSDPDCPRHPRACYANIGEFIEAGEMPVDLAGRYEAIKRLVRLGGAREKKRGKKGAAAAASASLFGSPGKKRKGGEEEKGEEGEGEKPAWQKVSRVGADYQVPELPAAGGGFLSDSPDERAENEQVSVGASEGGGGVAAGASPQPFSSRLVSSLTHSRSHRSGTPRGRRRGRTAGKRRSSCSLRRRPGTRRR